MQALTDLHVSPEVDRLMEEFSKTLRKIHETERLLRTNEEAAQKRSAQLKPTDFGWPDWVEPHMFVTHQGIVELTSIKDRLQAQMRRELNPGKKPAQVEAPPRPAVGGREPGETDS